MHVFLQGPKNIGKSTVILETIDLLNVNALAPLSLGGFFTWNGGKTDPHVYMRPAGTKGEGEAFLLASWDDKNSRLACDTKVFEEAGALILAQSEGADLIIMDELGFLESSAERFKQAVLDTLAGDVPVLGVLRLGDIPWHKDIKCDPSILLLNVGEENRNTLPKELAGLFAADSFRL